MTARIFFEDNPKPVATLDTRAQADALLARILWAYKLAGHRTIGPQSYRIEEEPAPPAAELEPLAGEDLEPVDVEELETP